MIKAKKIAAIAILASTLYIISNAPMAHAGGWAGSGGGLGNKCSGDDYALTTYKNGYGLCTYNGYGWVYYEYTQAATNLRENGAGPDIKYGPASTGSGGEFTIPAECIDYGGFWHFGIYAYKEIAKSSSLSTHNSEGVYWTKMSINGIGAFGNPMYGGTAGHGGSITGANQEDKQHDYYNFKLLKENVTNNHNFYTADGKTILAYSKRALTEYDPAARNAYETAHGSLEKYDGDVWAFWQDYNKIRLQKGLSEDTQWKINDRPNSTVTAFCSRPEIVDTDGVTFAGSVIAHVDGAEKGNGSRVKINDGNAHTVSFDHYIERTDENALIAKATSKYEVSPRGTPPSGSVELKKGKSKKVSSPVDINVTLAPGNEIEYCQILILDTQIDPMGTVTQRASVKSCVTLYRPNGTSDTSATFVPKQSCTVTAAGQTKSTGCDTESETNSKNWSITQTSWVHSNGSGQVNAGKIGSSTSPYNHSSLQYGVESTQCVRSTGPYTHYNWYVDSLGGPGATAEDSNITLREISPKIQDLPQDHPGEDNWHDTGDDRWVDTSHWRDTGEDEWVPDLKWEVVGKTWVAGHYECTYVGVGGTYKDSTCTDSLTGLLAAWNLYDNKWVAGQYVDKYDWVDHGSWEDVLEWVEEGHWEDIYDYYVDGCDNGKTFWHEFYNASHTKTWSNSNDDSLKLGSKNDKVSVSKCSAIEVTPYYSNGSWWGSSTAASCNTVTRYRRYAHFNAGNLGIKADPKNLSAATTTRNNGDTVDTTNDDGKFTVTFTYSLNRGETDNWKDGESSKNFKVKNRWSSMETVSAADGSNITYLINGNYNNWHEYGTFESTNANTTNASGTKTETITGQLYYGQKIKICGNLSYGDVVKETDSGSKRSHIIEQDAPQEVGCIYISRGESNCSNVVGDNPSATGYGFGHKTGYNVAKIGVLNASIGMTTPTYTSWSYNQSLLNVTGSIESSVGVWARPGDSIRYQVQYCMGANYSHAVHALNGISDGGVDTKMHMNGDSTARTTAETNKLNAAQRSNYLFGDTVGTYSGTTKSTTPITFNFMKYNNITGEGGDATEVNPESATIANNIGTKYSPDITSSTNLKLYSCPHGGGTDGYNNYYQIAGKVKRNGTYGTTDNYIIDGCGENRTQSLDVGRELSEQLIWTNERVNSATSMTVNGEYTHRAYVRVPYNYTAKPYLKNNSTPTGTVQIGGKMTTTPGIAVFPRKNCAFVSGYYTGALSQTACQNSTDSAATYATVTKPTTVKFETLLNGSIVAGSTKTMVVRGNTKSYRNGSKDVITSTESAGGPNLDSDYTIDVPNTAKAGDQVCIRMTITPADSHNSPTATTVWGASTSKTYAESTGSNDTVWWGLRESGDGIAYAQSSATVTTCSTAVKRPTISVEDSNLYTATSVATSVVARKNNNTQYLYGSWTEYGIFGKVITSSISDLGTLGMGSGASYGYNQTSFYANHSGAVSGYNPQPLTVVTYNGGPKNGVHNYNYGNVTSLTFQRRITYDYQRNDDGSRSYKLVSNGYVPIAPSYYVFASMPIVNAGNSIGSAPKNGSTICVHSTQTFANNNCDNGQVGTSGVGSDAAESFTTNLLAHYNTSKLKTSTVPGNATKYGDYVDITSANVPAGQIEGDENAAMYKYVKKAFLGYANGADIDLATLSLKQATPVEGYTLNQTVGSSIIYKADELVINSSIIANDDEKNNAGDFRMPIIIAGKVWLTGNPTRIDAIIITNELNTCKWNSFDDFRNSPSAGTVSMSNLTSDTCNKTVRFTAPVVVKGKVILNRTAGAGQGDDQIRRAEIFELNPATYLWSYAEASRYSQAITTYSRELPSRY